MSFCCQEPSLSSGNPVFKMASARHLGFLKFNFLTSAGERRDACDAPCMTAWFQYDDGAALPGRQAGVAGACSSTAGRDARRAAGSGAVRGPVEGCCRPPRARTMDPATAASASAGPVAALRPAPAGTAGTPRGAGTARLRCVPQPRCFQQDIAPSKKTHTRLMALFQDYPSKPVAER